MPQLILPTNYLPVASSGPDILQGHPVTPAAFAQTLVNLKSAVLSAAGGAHIISGSVDPTGNLTWILSDGSVMGGGFVSMSSPRVAIGEAYSQAEETAMFAAGFTMVVRMDLLGYAPPANALPTSTIVMSANALPTSTVVMTLL